jgi:hypothetical protein
MNGAYMVFTAMNLTAPLTAAAAIITSPQEENSPVKRRETPERAALLSASVAPSQLAAHNPSLRERTCWRPSRTMLQLSTFENKAAIAKLNSNWLSGSEMAAPEI